uniref:Transmembrane protein 132E n=1 Tax=Panthera tigris altaica TaxID=74533 RepID=A0A8C9KUI5_PANTA
RQPVRSAPLCWGGGIFPSPDCCHSGKLPAALSSQGQALLYHPLLRIGSISLFRPPPRRTLQEHRLDSNLMIRLPDRPLKPGEVLSVLLYLAPNSSSPSSPSVEHFTLRVKAKKGVTLLGTKSRSGQWHVTSELLTGAKHSTATVDVAWAQGTPLPPWEGQGPLEILQLDFEMENFTSQSVKRRIMWHIDYRGRSPLPDLERAVTELTVIQRDVQAILPLAMDTEIINTAILTGRTVAIPVKVIAIEVTGLVLDVSALVECESDNEDIIKVSSSCDYVFVSGKESRGSMNARVTFRYDILNAPLEMTVWVPKLPLHIELSDARLSQVKGWRVPILPDRRSARESEDEDEEEEERRQSASRGCTLQYQHATLQVFTQFHTTSSEGTDQVVTMLGPDWLVEVTDLVSDFMRVGDPRVARMVDSSTLAGLEPGTTPFKVVSPLTESVLGETLLTVTEEKVSITQLQAQVVASLALSLRPSPGSSHTILATTAAQQTLSFLKQEALLSLWLSYSDGTTAPLSLYSPRDYGLLVNSLDERVATVTQDRAFPLVVAQAEGAGELLRAELTIAESCQKTKRKSVLATTPVGLRVHFGRDEEDPTYDYPGPSQPGPGGALGCWGESRCPGLGEAGERAPTLYTLRGGKGDWRIVGRPGWGPTGLDSSPLGIPIRNGPWHESLALLWPPPLAQGIWTGWHQRALPGLTLPSGAPWCPVCRHIYINSSTGITVPGSPSLGSRRGPQGGVLWLLPIALPLPPGAAPSAKRTDGEQSRARHGSLRPATQHLP